MGLEGEFKGFGQDNLFIPNGCWSTCPLRPSVFWSTQDKLNSLFIYLFMFSILDGNPYCLDITYGLRHFTDLL